MRAVFTAMIRRHSLLLKGLKFGAVGALSSSTFAVITTIIVISGWAEPRLASALGYISSIPLNFVLNRNFSFRSKAPVLRDTVRYALLHIGNTLLTILGMSMALSFQLHYMTGIVLAVVAVPVLNFLAMNYWVFKDQLTQQPNELRSVPDEKPLSSPLRYNFIQRAGGNAFKALQKASHAFLR